MSEIPTNKEQRLAAVYDLLKYCRNPGHRVTTGLALRTELGVHPLPGGREDSLLATALEKLIVAELEQLRRSMGVEYHSASELPKVEDVFRRDLEMKHGRLELLSLVWAYYIKSLPIDTFTSIYNRSSKTVEVKLARGRQVVADLVAQHERATPPSTQLNEEVQLAKQDVNAPLTKAVTYKAARQQRNRRILLQKVRKFWITGVLERSLSNAVLLELGVQYRPDAVTHPWDMLVQLPDQPAHLLPPGTRIIDVFDELDGEMLILGTPGAGKTTTLLELTRELLVRAEQNPDHPMPVVFNLASWSEQRSPLARWLVDELSKRYGIPPKLGQFWIDTMQVLPLLDGLDEVKREHRTACVDAINNFYQNCGLSGLVVCSRSADYMGLHVKLRLQGAVELQPLTLQQIDRYLARLGEGTSSLRTALHTDSALQDLAQTPLLLNFLVLTYQGMSLKEGYSSGSLEDLFDAYIRRMFTRRSRTRRYTLEETARWLAWLATMMKEHAQAVFLIEWMQPDWLPTAAQRRRYIQQVGLLRGILVGVACGVLVVLSMMLLAVLSGWPTRTGMVRPTTVLMSELVGGLVFGVAFGVLGVLAARRTKAETIHVIEKLIDTDITS